MRVELKGADRRWFDRLMTVGTVAGLSDGELLRRFASRSDEAAFEALAARHGPMVLGVCRRILNDRHAAEDAFQATFLILVRRSRSLRDSDRLGPWLHGVARRVSLRLRQREARRRVMERPGIEAAAIEAPRQDEGRQERLSMLDDEIARMPERFRSPLILCYLQGLTHEEAALQLGCPLGTIRSRIARARDTLRARLDRRCGAIPGGLSASASEDAPAIKAAPVPPGLFDSTSRAAICLATGREILGAGVSTSAVVLSEEVLRMMMISRWKSAVVGLFLLGASIGGAALVFGQGLAREQSPKPAATSKRPEAPPQIPAKEGPIELRGLTLDTGGKPLADAVIVVGDVQPGRSGHLVLASDAQGRFTWKLPAGSKEVGIVAYKQGFAPAVLMTYVPSLREPHDIKLHLGKCEPFIARLVDAGGKPVAGAKLQVESSAVASEIREGTSTAVSTIYFRVPRGVIAGSPVEGVFASTTNAEGEFEFPAQAKGYGLKLVATAPDGHLIRIEPGPGVVGLVRQTLHNQGYVTPSPGETTQLLAVDAARIAGRVVSRLPGVGVSGLSVTYQASRQRGVYRPTANSGGTILADSDGRFTFDGLSEGTVNVVVHGAGENNDWTYRAGEDVKLVPGTTTEVTIELIRGVEVEGTVVVRGTNRPVDGAGVGVHGPFRPRTSAMTTQAKTDAQGRYRYRLPAGETYFYIMGAPSGFARLADEGSSRTLSIPENVTKFELPPIELEPAVTLRGRVLNAAGVPIAGAFVVGTCEGGRCLPFLGPKAVTDALGEFRLPPSLNNTVAIGKPARMLVRLADGAEYEASATPSEDGLVTLMLLEAKVR